MKTIMVTGADGGIGKSVVARLKVGGERVVMVTRADADLSIPTDVRALKNKIISETPTLDWLVCAHGFIDSEMVLEQQTTENIEHTFAVNTLSIIYLAQQLLPKLTKGIIAISSTAGVNANGRHAVYSASKAAVNNFMQGLARNRPEKKFFSICPGPTKTAMIEKVGGDPARAQDPTHVAELIAVLTIEKEEYKSGDVIVVRDGVVNIVSRLNS